MNGIKGRLSPALARDAQLQRTQDGLGRQASVQLGNAGKAGGAALHNGAGALRHGGGAVAEAGGATFELGRALGNAAKGAGAAVAGAVGAVGAVVADALGSALQWLGRGLIKLGNTSREVSGLGGDQITTRTVLGDRNGNAFHDRMFQLSGDSFRVAGQAWTRSVDHLAASGREAVDCARCVVAAAEKTVEAAVSLGNSAALKTAQGAVLVAREALMAAEQGVDGAGALLQKAGRAVIEAGNQVNTLRGSDTGVAVRAGRG